MYVTTSAPNRRSLGAVNGLGQTLVSLARGVGPALATSLYSLSVEENMLKGYAVYLFFSLFSMGALVLTTQLPYNLWGEEGGEEVNIRRH